MKKKPALFVEETEKVPIKAFSVSDISFPDYTPQHVSIALAKDCWQIRKYA